MESENELWSVVLLSTTVKEITPEQIEKDLAKRREVRKANGITGIVINARGNILLLAEGAKAQVQHQYEEIKKYQGHHSIIKLYFGPVPFRFFEEEPLAFKSLGVEAYKFLDSFTSIEQKEYFQEVLDIHHPVSRIISDFIKNNSK
ncbi:BLUF domain-containing protein [Desertivirga arenae]|uniref:BLUF domain-containing protein n=1 Tax=Desertivirga arenae TaxID=2810309 RepID=UPI001A979396|nr:BLUF domain-containing protein [Pedobacter sp. SYSU D00823]